MKRLVVSMAERIARGEIIEERRIERLKRKPRGCVGENWKEELREQNRKNICEELKRRGYDDVFYIRRWNEEKNDYFGFVRIDWIERVIGKEGKTRQRFGILVRLNKYWNITEDEEADCCCENRQWRKLERRTKRTERKEYLRRIETAGI